MQVRRLICACMVQIYIVGDTLPLYSRVASLQTYLGSKVRLQSTEYAAHVAVHLCRPPLLRVGC